MINIIVDLIRFLSIIYLVIVGARLLYMASTHKTPYCPDTASNVKQSNINGRSFILAEKCSYSSENNSKPNIMYVKEAPKKPNLGPFDEVLNK